MNNETFNSSDVIYLITPDRFSNGDKSNDKLSYLREKKINRENHPLDMVVIFKVLLIT